MSPTTSVAWPQMSGFGEAFLFFSVGAIMILAALGVLLFRKAAYSALCMVALMVGMAVLFFALEAPFNGAVQVIVYTGAIMMLFLFVIMMIGLGATDGVREQRRSYIVWAIILGVALAVFTVAAVFHSVVAGPGSIGGDPYSNTPVTSLAMSLFQNHWMTIILSAMLLIVAAVGAVVLTHSDRLAAKFSQRKTAEARMQEYRVKGAHLGQLPAPGVYARSNAVDNPAIAGDTLQIAEDSVPRVLRLRGLERPLGDVSAEAAASLQLARSGNRDATIWTNQPVVEQSRAWGMPGKSAPTGLRQVQQADATPAEAKETDK